MEDRLAVLERLKKKHGPTLADVIETASALREELEALAGARPACRGRRSGARQRAPGLSLPREKLSKARRTAAVDFAGRLVRSLGDLAMNQTRCEVRFVERSGEEGWTERGIDEGEFYISPNPGEDLRPLARIASGGELSRIMLALKTLASTDAPGKTLIFDEVDAGIGGSVADIVGARLRQLGSHVQVLCITHLPQIAAYGTSHYRIAKGAQGRANGDRRRAARRPRQGRRARPDDRRSRGVGLGQGECARDAQTSRLIARI